MEAITTTRKGRPTLYELTLEQLELLDRLDAILEPVEGEITPEIEDEVNALLVAQLEAEGAVEGKLEAYGRVMDQYKAEADADMAYAQVLRLRADSLDKRARVQKAAIERMRERIKQYLELVGKPKLKTQTYSFSVCKNGGKPPLTLDPIYALNPELLPERFRKVIVEPDKERIRAELEGGGELPFARLEERGTHLRIK